LPATAKVVVAGAVAAATMALLGYAGSGRLGNFGDVGVDQATFAPAIFLWFVGIGALTVAMAGGIARRPKAPKPVPEPEQEPDVDEEPLDEDEPPAPVEAAAPVDNEDPEEHFVADDDTTQGATGDESRGPSD
jgi:hypothetical protein